MATPVRYPVVATEEGRGRGRADDLDLAVPRYDIAPLAERLWDLRHRYTAYLALADVLGVSPHASDRTPADGGHGVPVHVYG